MCVHALLQLWTIHSVASLYMYEGLCCWDTEFQIIPKNIMLLDHYGMQKWYAFEIQFNIMILITAFHLVQYVNSQTLRVYNVHYHQCMW